MTVVLDLPPEMESKMQELAQAEGLDLSTLVRETMAARLRQYDPSRFLTEAELLARIIKGFPEAFWGRRRNFSSVILLRTVGIASATVIGVLLSLALTLPQFTTITA